MLSVQQKAIWLLNNKAQITTVYVDSKLNLC